MSRIKILLFFLLVSPITHAQQSINQELPLVVLICSYNNSKWVVKNLESVFSQQYNNFRVIYMDDCSTDDTVALVQEYIEQHDLEDKVTLVTHSERHRKMKHLYNAIHSCADDEIIVQLDGDDWFIDSNFFKDINKKYHSENVWLTYGSYKDYPSGKRGSTREVPAKVVKNRSYRTYGFLYKHPRTFYAWLFKLIKLEDVMVSTVPGYKGKFIPASNDLATMIPMVEMAHKKVRHLSKITYAYNLSNPILGNRVDDGLQQQGARELRSWKPYPIIKKPIINRLRPFEDAQADMLIFSQNTPGCLKRLIESVNSRTIGIDAISVLYEENKDTADEYALLKEAYPYIQFVSLLDNELLPAVHTLLLEMPHAHALLAKDTVYVQEDLNINNCIQQLETTFAHGFYLGFAHDQEPFSEPYTLQEIVPHQHICSDLYAWKFRDGIYNLFYNIDMTLFNKKTVLDKIAQFSEVHTIASFFDQWQLAHQVNLQNVGLFYGTKKLGGTLTTITKQLDPSYTKSTLPTALRRKRR